MAKPKKADLIKVEYWTERAAEYVHLFARCIQERDPKDPYAERPFNRLKVYSQGNKSDGEKRLYAWKVYYTPLSGSGLDLEDASVALKTLKALNLRMAKMHDLEGPCASFGAYVTRFARACGAGAMLSRGRHELGLDHEFDVGRESIQMIDAEVARLFERAQAVTT